MEEEFRGVWMRSQEEESQGVVWRRSLE